MGRFLTRDTWPGQANRPLSFNRWGYVEGNPVNSIDPEGESPIDSACSTNTLLCLLNKTPHISSVSMETLILHTDCNNINTNIKRFYINLSAYYMPVGRAGTGSFEGEPIYVGRKYNPQTAKYENAYYDENLNWIFSKKKALKTDPVWLNDPQIGVCMQGTVQLILDSGKTYYLYCNTKERGTYEARSLPPPVIAFETAARATLNNNPIFYTGEKVTIPALAYAFRSSSCSAYNHDSTVTISSAGEGLKSDTLDIFVGAGDQHALQSCMTAIWSLGKNDRVAAYVERKWK